MPTTEHRKSDSDLKSRSGGGSHGSSSTTGITHELKGLNYPCGKQEIIKQAKHNGADQAVLERMSKLPDKKYASMADLMKEYGKSE